MDIFLAWDGDHIGREVGRASLADDEEGLRRISQAITQGNVLWRSWVESHGGSIISDGGDEGRAKLPADYLDELPKIRQQYAGAVNAAVSVGVGTKLSEADQALLAAKLQGGDRVVFYTEEAAKLVAQAKEKGEKTEEMKIADEYLNKAWRFEPRSDMELRIVPIDKIDHIPWNATDGDEHERGVQEYMHGLQTGKVPMPWGYDTDGVIDVRNGDGSHRVEAARRLGHTQVPVWVKKSDESTKFLKAAPAMHPGAYAGASPPSGASVEQPAGAQGEHSEGQVAIDQANEEGQSPEMTNAAAGFEDQFHQAAAAQEQEDTKQAIASTKNIADVKQRVAQALMMLKQQAPMLEQMKQAAPEAYAAVSGLAQAVIGLARELGGGQGQPMQKAELAKTQNPHKAGDRVVLNKPSHPSHGKTGTVTAADYFYPSVRLDDGTPETAIHHLNWIPQASASAVLRAGSTPEDPLENFQLNPKGAEPSVPVGGEELRDHPQQWVERPDPDKSICPRCRMPGGIDPLSPGGNIHKCKSPSCENRYEVGPGGQTLPAMSKISQQQNERRNQERYLKQKTNFVYPNKFNTSADEARIAPAQPANPVQRDPRTVYAEQNRRPGVGLPKPKGAEILRDAEEKPMGEPLQKKEKPKLPRKPKKLEKGKLPMPNASSHHRVVLPAGSSIAAAPSGAVGTVAGANKIKVQHSDGSTSVKQVEAGMIRSQDPSGHPVSGRSPDSK